MVDYEAVRRVVAAALKSYVNCPVIRSNQNTEPPDYPYISYTITTLEKSTGGTYCIAKDGTRYKDVAQYWSITALSDNSSESVTIALKAKEYFSLVGNVHLSDNGVVVKETTDITNRDNLITTEYEYRNGFDVVLRLTDVIDAETANGGAGYIETVEIDNETITRRV